MELGHHEQHVVGTGIPLDQLDSSTLSLTLSCCKHVQSLLPFYTGGCERVVLDALPFPVQSRLPTCAAGCQLSLTR